MSLNIIVTENLLDEWVRGNARDAQGVIVELLYRLVAVSCPKPKLRRFPLGDSIGQHGPDGDLDTDRDFDPFVPIGRSIWEIGTGLNSRDKATRDYEDSVRDTPAGVRAGATFVFVTPLSGRRDWEYTWKEDNQAKWVEERLGRNEWQDVRVLDGTRLTDWLRSFPEVEEWLAEKMKLPGHYIETPEQRWALLESFGAPPPLTPDLFLVNRDIARRKVDEVFSGGITQLKLETHFPRHVADFVAAHLHSMDENSKAESVGRCLIVSSTEIWKDLMTLPKHFLVVSFDVDDSDEATRLLQMAYNSGHTVIFGGTPGGLPHPYQASLPSPKAHQVREALEKAGHIEERARVLAQKSNGDLNSLMRIMQGGSLLPEWAQGTVASELVVAEYLGAWKERNEADIMIVEKLVGKTYGEWIGTMREIALRPGTPLIQIDDTWKFTARFEGWYALGPRAADEHLERLRLVAVSVLREKDPKFELAPNERYAAGIHGKVLTHSDSLRKGLAESLALIGSHPKALSSCIPRVVVATAILAVREILTGADWVLWGSLDGLLPLLAEAAPDEFLEAVENALGSAPCPFDMLFAQEGAGFMGWNYMSGLLWALETLAWDNEYLVRVVVDLGRLAARDPGGSYANRPGNSISTILLPWHPQTCATVPKRLAAVETLMKELPDVAWRLLLDLLPRPHQVSMGSRKPAWREIIPD
ncbi:MAG: hypothetical protein E4G91_00390, partial [Candidatus Zixiibacteriota bacterium]